MPTKVVSLLKQYRTPMTFAWILMVIELVVELTSPLFMAKIVDEGVLPKNLDGIIFWGTILVGISFLSFIAGIINSFIASSVSQNFGFSTRKYVFQKVQNLPYSELAKYSTASFITRLTNDVTQLQNTVFMSMRVAMRAPLLIIFGTVMALLV